MAELLNNISSITKNTLTWNYNRQEIADIPDIDPERKKELDIDYLQESLYTLSNAMRFWVEDNDADDTPAPSISKNLLHPEVQEYMSTANFPENVKDDMLRLADMMSYLADPKIQPLLANPIRHGYSPGEMTAINWGNAYLAELNELEQYKEQFNYTRVSHNAITLADVDPNIQLTPADFLMPPDVFYDIPARVLAEFSLVNDECEEMFAKEWTENPRQWDFRTRTPEDMKVLLEAFWNNTPSMMNTLVPEEKNQKQYEILKPFEPSKN